jgi:DUF1680 family protein
LHAQTGETCCSSFWIRYNQRFHLLRPNQEKYVNEIEKSIYNVIIADQDSSGICRLANLVGIRDTGRHINSCCEGQGTRLIGSLPEFIYSIADDGLYVNLYAGSTITWKLNGEEAKVHMETRFPYDNKVKLVMHIHRPLTMKLHVRIPKWANKDMTLYINDKKVASGDPGTYVTLDRKWHNGDEVTFNLPMSFRLVKYHGMDEFAEDGDHYALEYGPLLMAVVGGKINSNGNTRIALSPNNIIDNLRPIPGKPLHFTIEGDCYRKYIPYFEVKSGTNFSSYPEISMYLDSNVQ